MVFQPIGNIEVLFCLLKLSFSGPNILPAECSTLNRLFG
jgi:hypothetical protein